MSLADDVVALQNQVANLRALVQGSRDQGKWFAMLGQQIIYGCMVKQGFGTAMTLSLQGAASGDGAHLNPLRVDPSPARVEQYGNLASVYGEVFLAIDKNIGSITDTNLTVSTAPGTGYHRYDAVYAYVGIAGPAIGIAAGASVANANSPVLATIPAGTIVLAQVHVQSNVTSILDAAITDLRNFSGRLTGATGSTGSVGATGMATYMVVEGDQGEDGPPGGSGPQGIQGVQGVAGVIGTPGFDGIDGEDGSIGPAGMQGIQGIQGIPGAAGVMGFDGQDGNDGEKGPIGDQGVKGDIGIQGVAGPLGMSGEDGEDAIYGPQGIQGIQGVQGVQGFGGPMGVDGETGEQGDSGPPGNFGPQGQQGVQGAPGPVGFDGEIGEDGAIGAQGNQGVQGVQGTQGVSGPMGINGDDGDDGLPGSPGSPGPKGADGAQGAAGIAVFLTEQDQDTDFHSFPPGRSAVSRHEVMVSVGNGHGSSYQGIRRFTTTNLNVGTAITYADSATQGASFTINEEGLYAIQSSDIAGVAYSAGASVNASAGDCNVAIQAVAAANILFVEYTVAGGAQGISLEGACVRYCFGGDVIRAHTDGGPTSTLVYTRMHITKIS
jgi:hypothetical protein